jgi:hypothetical protein
MAKDTKASAHCFQLDHPGLVIDAGHFAVATSNNGTIKNSTVQLPEDIDIRRSNCLCNSSMTAQSPGCEGSLKISVIVPVRNGRLHLAQCLDALVRSEYPSFEVIVVDDCSTDTDSTPQIAERYGARYLQTSRTMGPGVASPMSPSATGNNSPLSTLCWTTVNNTEGCQY